jgi:hypothetical protein
MSKKGGKAADELVFGIRNARMSDGRTSTVNRVIPRYRAYLRESGTSNGNDVRHVRVIGRAVRSRARSRYVLTSAETAPCTCPDFCERDHANE